MSFFINNAGGGHFMRIEQADVKNRLLRLLPPRAFACLGQYIERVECEKGDYLFRHDEPASHAYFLESGLGSLVAVSRDELRVEAGLFGKDGFAPAGLAQGDDKPCYDGLIIISGEAFRIEAQSFKDCLSASTDLRKLMQRYFLALSIQTVQTVMSGAMRHIDQRLARWVLMCDDRLDFHGLPLTHEDLAHILSVQRTGVTHALHTLEGDGLIKSERGCIIIRDRAGLEAFAGAAYGTSEAEYERLVAPLQRAEDRLRSI